MFHRQRVIAAAIAGLLCAALGAADEVNQKAMSAEQRGIVDGAELYAELCSTCHGAEGRGDGPAQASLPKQAPDLSVLARDNGGKFPVRNVRRLIQRKAPDQTHGERTMPVWGPTLVKMTGGAALAPYRVQNLVSHVESLQR